MRFLATCTIVLMVFGNNAHAQLTPPNDYKQVGAAKLRVLWFDIYDAELSSPDGRFSRITGPLMLKLTYLRDIKKKKLLEETANQLRAIEPPRVQIWLNQLERIWPEINRGDHLAFYLDAEGFGHFYFNEHYVGSINDARFGKAFISIWLGQNSDYPELARKLRGES
ncbi:chalcone isomerase family protein [Pontibacterium granulatum]|uniref:chalcone isomerase family protein n=1 Tax=Pontibacterium granulatum TaxID=2036029 RepID=UPI002499FF3D|nr:chalcone isomerase family protein [Pontibacterium granulatum]MDI3324106.1 chalcone isomerase family protein [Pontibacterium granulatum]